VTVAPETSPINPSPWYAFDLATDAPDTVEVTLRFTEAAHRYHPKRLDEGGTWKRLAEGDVRLEAGGSRAILTLVIPDGRTRFAAPEVFGPEDRNEWVRGFAGRASLETFIIGRSVEGRELLGIRRRRREARYRRFSMTTIAIVSSCGSRLQLPVHSPTSALPR